MIDDYFKNLERSAIVLTPQQPFFDWIKSHDPAVAFYDEMKESEIYLLPDYETREEMEKWLKKNFEVVFFESKDGFFIA